jgi:hypothetical protein
MSILVPQKPSTSKTLGKENNYTYNKKHGHSTDECRVVQAKKELKALLK